MKTNLLDIKLLLIRYTVAKDEHKILEALVPIKETIRYFDFLSKILFARLLSLYFCFIQTSICKVFEEISAISALENIIDKINPIIAKFNSNMIY